MTFVYNEDSVTAWLRDISPLGGEEAVQRLWERYFEQLVRLARQKLGPIGRRISDEEDVALSAFDSFCRGAAAGRYPKLNDREDLWRLLVAITCNKAVDHHRREHRRKRGDGAVRGESAFALAGQEEDIGGIGQVVGREPTPEMAVMVADECAELLKRLADDELRSVALLRLQNYTVVEISRQLGCSLRTVKRRLALIREKWRSSADDS